MEVEINTTGLISNERLDFVSKYLGFLLDFDKTIITIDNLFSAKMDYIMPHISTSVFRHPTAPGRLCIISIIKSEVIYNDLTYDIKIFNNSISNYRVEKRCNDLLIIATESLTNKICWHFISEKKTYFYDFW
jgi:hypothetical protein